ncbi:MAG: pyrroline-5-carboxylate reductase [Myxococcales bacterium]|nr:pyrroline-5-carboxylate reductase [Myxococcales bacterium]MCB9733513.1 pyrroline-5-carboxylate reductase [Deltaproteobacteria bacterium]
MESPDAAVPPAASFRLAVLGVGHMGEALVRGVVGAGVVPAGAVTIADRRPEPVAALVADLGVRAAPDVEALAAAADVLVVAVKPQDVRAALGGLRGALGPDRVLLSIAAGTTIATLAAAVGDDVPIVRAMPNTPCLVGAGASAFALGPAAGPDHADLARRVLGSVGVVHEVAEDLIDAVTALSGSGPAYVFHLMAAMAQAGAALGLPAAVAADLALHTVLGSAKLALASDVDAATLRNRVMSPGGTTEAAIRAFDAGGFTELVETAMTAARDRGRELGAGVGATRDDEPEAPK